MAETGVTESSSPSGSRESGNRGGGSFFKRNKKVILIGGAVGGFLLVSHKGSQSGSSSGSSTADLTQQTADALAAQQAALESGNVYAPSGYDPSLGGGGGSSTSDTGTGSSSPAAPATPSTININIPANEPPKTGTTKPNKKGKTHHKAQGAHTQNPHRTESGTGHGVTVHGRTFPGARGVTTHPPKKQPNGDTHTRITVHHGGHTSHHTSVNNGQRWIDHTKGHNPPSRSVPTTHGHAHAHPPAPHRVPTVAHHQHKPVRKVK